MFLVKLQRGLLVSLEMSRETSGVMVGDGMYLSRNRGHRWVCSSNCPAMRPAVDSVIAVMSDLVVKDCGELGK